jgi:hypothetical protein
VHGGRNSEVSTYPERVALNGTISLAAAGVGAEINTAEKQASSSGMRSPAVGLN